jgi:deazaflavin-dependent oxidoreductase (nitroreductase family)
MSERPTGFMRFLFRAPVPFFRRGFGGLFRALGLPWIELHTRGRKSGRPYTVLLDCLHEDSATGRYFVQSAYGMQADWVRNALAQGTFEAALGRDRFAATLEQVSDEEAQVIADAVRGKHPIYARLVALIMGQRDLSDAGLQRWAARFPTLAIRRTSPSPLPLGERSREARARGSESRP